MRVYVQRFVLTCVLLSAVAGDGRAAEGVDDSLVFINGKSTRVWFNDGDTFRMMEGPWKGTGARLTGFNTLESWGPVHSWGDWDPFELYVIAKKATLNGRRGVWHCTTDGKRDQFDRLLVFCPALALDQIRKGLAHAMRTDDTHSALPLLKAQRLAIKEKRGIWAKGVPEFIMTSLHTRGEEIRKIYNRQVSTRDGHSEKPPHNDRYRECERVCATEERPDYALIASAVERMQQEPSLQSEVALWHPILLEEFAVRYARKDELPAYADGAPTSALRAWLKQEKAAGRLGEVKTVPGSCQVFTYFLRRFDENKAPCLKEHGLGRPQ